MRNFWPTFIRGLVLLCGIFAATGLQGQKFEASGALGFNASQLDGDNLSGFNKLGLHGGVRMAYPLTKSGWSLEMLLHQKGSTESLSFGRPRELQSITLHYLSVPVLYYWDEWYDDQLENHKIRLDVGIVNNVLFNVSSSNPNFDGGTDEFKRFDVGLTAGLGYRLGYRWMAVFRYERSVLRIHRDPISGTTGLQSYLMNFRLEYEF